MIVCLLITIGLGMFGFFFVSEAKGVEDDRDGTPLKDFAFVIQNPSLPK